MESGEAFDVVAVVGRAVRMQIAGAPPADLAWADRAADLVRGWADAWQAQVQFEMTLPRPLPDLDDIDTVPGADDVPAGGDAAAGADTDRDAAADAASAGRHRPRAT